MNLKSIIGNWFVSNEDVAPERPVPKPPAPSVKVVPLVTVTSDPLARSADDSLPEHGAPEILNKFSEHINVLSGFNQEVKAKLQAFREEHDHAPKFLDVGGRFGERKKEFATNFDYCVMDIEDGGGPNPTVVGDICHCPEIESDQFDVVFSHSVFEHLAEPWNAAKECYRITKPGGLLLHIAPFSWRYHPCPIDYFRFSAQGLRFLFERAGNVDTVISGYNIRLRRADLRGDDANGGVNIPPVDELGGWRENWYAVFMGRKLPA